MKLSLAPFDRGERVVETERILELLIESRFGPGTPYLHFADSYDTESMADNVIYDLMPACPLPIIGEVLSADEMFDRKYEVNEDTRLRSAATPATMPALPRTPTTLARGSPAHATPRY